MTKIRKKLFKFFNGSPKLYKLQPNYYAVYSRPIENIANFFAVCELKIFL